MLTETEFIKTKPKGALESLGKAKNEQTDDFANSIVKNTPGSAVKKVVTAASNGMTDSSGSVMTKPRNDSPANTQKGYVKSNVPYDQASGGWGVRALMENAGLDSNKIGYDGEYVTYNGSRLFAPSVNIAGTTYAPKATVYNAINRAAAIDGDELIQISDYNNKYGITDALGYNPATGEVTLAGKSVPYAYIDDSGRAWVRKSDADRMYSDLANEMNIKDNERLLEDYKTEIAKNQNDIDSAIDRMQNYSMTAAELENNPYWQAYRQMYLREGARAASDQQARASAQNGGNLSSAALAAAGSVQNDYTEGLMDRLPEVYDTAYEQFTAGLNAQITNAQNKMQTAQNMYETEYGQSLDNLSRQREVAQSAFQRMLNTENLAQQKAATDTSILDNAIKRAQAAGAWDDSTAAVLGINKSADGTYPDINDPEINRAIRILEEVTKPELDYQAKIQLERELKTLEQSHKFNLEELAAAYGYDLGKISANAAEDRTTQAMNNAFERENSSIEQQYALEMLDKQAAIDKEQADTEHQYKMEMLGKENEDGSMVLPDGENDQSFYEQVYGTYFSGGSK